MLQKGTSIIYLSVFKSFVLFIFVAVELAMKTNKMNNFKIDIISTSVQQYLT